MTIERSDSEGNCPVLVIAYDNTVRDVLVKNLIPFGTRVAACATFCEAESVALEEPCRGVLVDLPSLIRAKGEEKLVSYSLTRFYPTLRVRAMGPMIIPMVMPGDAKQDASLNDFVTKTCAASGPRRLRGHKRKDICVPTFIGEARGFTLNISWGGAFIADMAPERFTVGDKLKVNFPECSLSVEARVARAQLWGNHLPPGIGVEFLTQSQEFDQYLRSLLGNETARDRLVI